MVIAAISIILLVVVLLFLVQLKKLLRSLQQHVGPVTDRARVAAENVEYVTALVRQDVQKVRASVSGLSDRLGEASERMEERVEEFNALMDVVQDEAESVLLDTAALVRGVRAGAKTVGGGVVRAAGQTYKSRHHSRGRTTPKPKMRWEMRWVMRWVRRWVRRWPGGRPREREDRLRPWGSFGLDPPKPRVTLGVGAWDAYRSGRGCPRFALPASPGRSYHPRIPSASFSLRLDRCGHLLWQEVRTGRETLSSLARGGGDPIRRQQPGTPCGGLRISRAFGCGHGGSQPLRPAATLDHEHDSGGWPYVLGTPHGYPCR